jgi:flagellar assembly protein FliH
VSKPTFPYDKIDEAKPWNLPNVEDTRAQDENVTNAFNHSKKWKYEPPEIEEEMLPPTAAEIEAIRAAAYEDGLAQGLQEGKEKGLEQGIAEGHQQGLESGLAQGKEQGLAMGQDEIQQQITIWQQLLDKLHKPVARVDQELQKELIILAVSLAKAVIRAEVKTNNDVIFQALSEGLKVLPIQEKCYQIHLHPQDIVLIKNHFSEEEIEKHNWLFIEAPQMSRGGCDIVTTSNAVDVSIERRCRDVLDRFLLDQGMSDKDNTE